MNDCITALEYEGGVLAIDSGMVRPQMAACYLLETDSAVAVIEVGNNDSAGRIVKVLESRGRDVMEVSHVIVTHVHLDHAGGAGKLMQELPNASLLVHPRGARHMIDPSRLEASARAVYGDPAFDSMYGSLIPVPEDRVKIIDEGDSVEVGGRKLAFIDTPGHARHHFCVWDEQTRGWFSGDTFGISYRELDTAAGPFIFPTTTPVQFDPQALTASVQRMMQYEPDHMYLTHFGRVSDVERLARQMTEGVQMFAELGERQDGTENRSANIQSEMMAWLTARARAHGVTCSDEDLREIFAGDVLLNTQGIEFWLDHGRG
ncbi:MAG: MBL fold metallo-hydrolase [Xanthomonadales bacterium]|jgi:glyoxylase-like metal-dependent hydrolase (beta-lactamase superfamily II)|nr:MBL fold metallo-hydrolase [Xanthomonadales bacterium]MDH3923886.1 MBL fold metallo-hydrolase [Xanthomonadales bacterium]MDH3939728.1 MBL fold metallo-hydrolase [Xanthomonadales bacterium]MDH4000485.1 MBL fold metallo-hydrolase [Xanthomonadales bacterium]